MTGRGVEWVSLWDGRRWPGRVRNGLPEFRFGQAPAGLSTRRQLRERGLSRGGQEPFARLVWKKDQRFAWLYVDAKARPKRTPSSKQLAAVEKALAARKVCGECGPVDHFVRTSDQLCGDCHAAGVQPGRAEPATWQTLHQWQQANHANQDNEDDRDERAAEVSPRSEVAAAVQRAADTVERLSDRDADDHEDVDERDEQLARWHDDAAPQHASSDAADTTGQDWLALEAGAA